METRVDATYIDNQVNFINEEKALLFCDKDMPFMNPEILNIDEVDRHRNTFLDIRVSDKNVFLVSSNVGVYNFFYSVLSSIIRLHKTNKDAIFIIETCQVDHASDNKHFIKTFGKVLSTLNIDHEFVNLDNFDGVFANNFFLVPPGTIFFNRDDVLLASAACLQVAGVSQKNKDTIKKTYVSRKRVIDDRSFAELVKPGLSFDRDFRINNEDILESFLINCGFDVVCPEDFDSMEDQIRYFSNVDVLFSVTSSGIANAMFMKPGSTIIEATTTFLMMNMSEESKFPPYDAYESIHHIYNNLCYIMDHEYFAIPNASRKAEDIRDRIINSKYLKQVFGLGE